VKGYFCCLMRLRKMSYYSNHEDIESFLLEIGSGNAI
jgi:hypothetical protein